MKSLTRIKTHGIKRIDHDVPLTRRTALLGDSGRGKTAILDGIALAVLGSLPGRKSLADIAKSMHGSRMVSTLTTEDGQQVTRSIMTDGDSLSRTADASWCKGKGLTARDIEIRQKFGGDSAEWLLDIRQLLRASDSERAKIIAEMLDSCSVPPAEIARRGSLLYIRSLGLKARAADSDLADGPWGSIAPAYRRAAENVHQWLQDRLISSSLMDALSKCGEAKRIAQATARNTVKSREAAEATLRDLRASMADAPAVSEVDRDMLRDEIAREEERIRQLSAAADRKDERSRAIPHLRERLRQEQEGAQWLQDQLPRIPEWEAQISAIVDPPEVEAPPVVSVSDEIRQQADALYQESMAATQAARALNLPEIPDVSAAEREYASVEERHLKQIDPNGAAYHLHCILQDLYQALPESPIPERLRHWAERFGVVADVDIEQARIDLRAAVDHQRTCRELYTAIRLEIKAHEDRAAAKLAESRKLIQDAELAARTINLENAKRYMERRSDRKKAVSENASRRNEMRNMIQELQQSASVSAERIAKAQAEIDAALAYIDGIGEIPDIKPMQEALDLQRGKLREMEKNLARWREIRETEAGIERLAQDIGAADAEGDCYSVAESTIKTLRAEELQGKGAKLTEEIDAMLSASGLGVRSYLEVDKGSTDLGWIRDGERVSEAAMSGGERAVFLSALGAACLAIKDPEYGFLVVEAAEAGSRAMFDALVATLDKAKCQVILASNAEGLGFPDGWSLVDMETMP